MLVFLAFPKELLSDSEDEEAGEELSTKQPPEATIVVKERAKDKGKNPAVEEKEKEQEKARSESSESNVMKDDATTFAPRNDPPVQTPPPPATKEKEKN